MGLLQPRSGRAVARQRKGDWMRKWLTKGPGSNEEEVTSVGLACLLTYLLTLTTCMHIHVHTHALTKTHVHACTYILLWSRILTYIFA